MFYALIAVSVVVAAADWWAVQTENKRAEYLLKPAVMVALIAALLVMAEPDPSTARPLFLLALIFSLLGDVFLMLEDKFVPGLASFLVAHIFYLLGFILMGLTPLAFIVGLLLAAVVYRRLGVKIVKGAVEADRALGMPVAAYIATISLMLTFAIGTLNPIAILGAALFVLSDALIGWTRFVAEIANGKLYIIVTYHLAQVALVLSLLGTP